MFLKVGERYSTASFSCHEVRGRIDIDGRGSLPWHVVVWLADDVKSRFSSSSSAWLVVGVAENEIARGQSAGFLQVYNSTLGGLLLVCAQTGCDELR